MLVKYQSLQLFSNFLFPSTKCSPFVHYFQFKLLFLFHTVSLSDTWHITMYHTWPQRTPLLLNSPSLSPKIPFPSSLQMNLRTNALWNVGYEFGQPLPCRFLVHLWTSPSTISKSRQSQTPFWRSFPFCESQSSIWTSSPSRSSHWSSGD